MAQYIDKSAVVAEIENRIKKYTLLQQKPEMSDLQKELQDKIDCLNSIKGYILNTLEVKEVDLEKEIYDAEDRFGDIDEMGGYRILIFDDEFRDILRHFFNLGLEAQKGI